MNNFQVAIQKEKVKKMKEIENKEKGNKMKQSSRKRNKKENILGKH